MWRNMCSLSPSVEQEFLWDSSKRNRMKSYVLSYVIYYQYPFWYLKKPDKTLKMKKNTKKSWTTLDGHE